MPANGPTTRSATGSATGPATGTVVEPEPTAPGPCGGQASAACDNNIDFDFDFEDYGKKNSPDIELDSIRESRTIYLPVDISYTDCGPRDAFRELVHNWRDAIWRQTWPRRDFRVIRSQRSSGRSTEIVYEAVADDDDNDDDNGSNDATSAHAQAHTHFLTLDEQQQRQQSQQSLGYIRFASVDGKGTVDIVNRAATLRPRHLGLMGGVSIFDIFEDGSRPHGEGLKIALLALIRGQNNYHVRCRSGGFDWTFGFSSGKHERLITHLRRMGPPPRPPPTLDSANDKGTETQQGQQQQQQHQQKQHVVQTKTRTLLPFTADPKSDVQFVIGELRRGYKKGNGDAGEWTERSPVRLADFEAWTKAVLFLHNAESDAIITASPRTGDLLMAPQLQGMLYVGGFLLRESTTTPEKSASMTRLPLRYGYNFARVRVNRERVALASIDEEAQAICAIWEAVLAARPDMVATLSDLLNRRDSNVDKDENKGKGKGTAEEPPLYADVAAVEKYATKTMAVLLKEHVCKEISGAWWDRDLTKDPWCYDRDGDEEEDDESESANPRPAPVIIRSLGHRAVALSKTYWAILRRHKLVHTAAEEELRRFVAAPPAIIGVAVDRGMFSTNGADDVAFSMALWHLLRACFRACPQMRIRSTSNKTRSMDFVFVQAGRLDLSLAYSAGELLFRIHDRWLCIAGAATELGMVGATTTTDPSGRPIVTIDLAGEDTGSAGTDILLQAARSLFADVLDQLPLALFRNNEKTTTKTTTPININTMRATYVAVAATKTPARLKKMEVNLADRRLRNFLCIWKPMLAMHGTPRQGQALSVRWASGSNRGTRAEIEVQCHRESTCAHIRDNVLIAEEASRDTLPCLAQQENLAAVTCRASRKLVTDRVHVEHNLKPGEEYFFLLVMTPADPGAIVSFSEVFRCGGPQLPPLVPASAAPVTSVPHPAAATVTPSAPGVPAGPPMIPGALPRPATLALEGSGSSSASSRSNAGNAQTERGEGPTTAAAAGTTQRQQQQPRPNLPRLLQLEQDRQQQQTRKRSAPTPLTAASWSSTPAGATARVVSGTQLEVGPRTWKPNVEDISHYHTACRSSGVVNDRVLIAVLKEPAVIAIQESRRKRQKTEDGDGESGSTLMRDSSQ